MLDENQYLANKLIKNFEEDNRNIGELLYEVISQNLYSISLGLKMVKRNTEKDNLNNYLESLEDVTSETIKQVLDLSFHLYPKVIDDLGLIAAIQTYVQNYSPWKLNDYEMKGRENEEGASSNVIDKKLQLFRIVRDCLEIIEPLTEKDDLKISYANYGGRMVVQLVFYRRIREEEIKNWLFIPQKRTEMANGEFSVYLLSSESLGVIIEI
ncbi:hypothetical protein [Metabacillus fastidiosus]|uniref:hypothetical protein n=1 Tax=Metabacillus fastidiosus TaxID=1458 RepID=UPI003D2A54E7